MPTQAAPRAAAVVPAGVTAAPVLVPGAVPHVPRFAGKPCTQDGTCPFSNCTICGNYCGPGALAAQRGVMVVTVCGVLTLFRLASGWCGGSCVPEGRHCDFSVQPQAGSCTDRRGRVCRLSVA